MMINRGIFLLVGSAPYLNRGCEAIVRGTVEIIRDEFGSDPKFVGAFFGNRTAIANQRAEERDPAISHVALRPAFGTRTWWRREIKRRIQGEKGFEPLVIDPYLDEALVALEIGGDNYSLDYSNAMKFIQMDQYLQKRGIPVVLWGASVGPFSANPQVEEAMASHLPAMAAIMVRESLSEQYLKELGVSDNLYKVADPAFLLKPQKPTDNKLKFSVPNGALGLNLSPLMARYVTKGDLESWVGMSVEIVEGLIKNLGRPIILIPHVTAMERKNCDDHFLRRVSSRVSEAYRGKIMILPPRLSAAETKWVIGRCSLFAGARTHATIAAFSTEVPTLSLGYSVKARGINLDIFDTLDYCLDSTDLTPLRVIERMVQVEKDSLQIKRLLRTQLPKINQNARQAGKFLREALQRVGFSL